MKHATTAARSLPPDAWARAILFLGRTDAVRTRQVSRDMGGAFDRACWTGPAPAAQATVNTQVLPPHRKAGPRSAVAWHRRRNLRGRQSRPQNIGRAPEAGYATPTSCQWSLIFCHLPCPLSTVSMDGRPLAGANPDLHYNGTHMAGRRKNKLHFPHSTTMALHIGHRTGRAEALRHTASRHATQNECPHASVTEESRVSNSGPSGSRQTAQSPRWRSAGVVVASRTVWRSVGVHEVRRHSSAVCREMSAGLHAAMVPSRTHTATAESSLLAMKSTSSEERAASSSDRTSASSRSFWKSPLIARNHDGSSRACILQDWRIKT